VGRVADCRRWHNLPSLHAAPGDESRTRAAQRAAVPVGSRRGRTEFVCSRGNSDGHGGVSSKWRRYVRCVQWKRRCLSGQRAVLFNGRAGDRPDRVFVSWLLVGNRGSAIRNSVIQLRRELRLTADTMLPRSSTFRSRKRYWIASAMRLGPRFGESSKTAHEGLSRPHLPATTYRLAHCAVRDVTRELWKIGWPL
jgi:hypothetical protein